jgi:hypothetical protein
MNLPRSVVMPQLTKLTQPRTPRQAQHDKPLLRRCHRSRVVPTPQGVSTTSPRRNTQNSQSLGNRVDRWTGSGLLCPPMGPPQVDTRQPGESRPRTHFLPSRDDFVCSWHLGRNCAKPARTRRSQGAE